MTTRQPHPQRCETCTNTDCDLHEQGRGNRNPDTGYEWDHYHWYHKIIDEKGCASHSSRPAPAEDAPNDGIWRMPITQKDDDYPNATMTYYEPIPERIVAAIRKDEREKVLDILREWSIAQYEISGVIDTMELKQKIDSLRSEEVRK